MTDGEIEIDEAVDAVVADERIAVSQRDERSEATVEVEVVVHPNSETAENTHTASFAGRLQHHSPCLKIGGVVAFVLGGFAVVHFELATELSHSAGAAENRPGD